jgi:hypothetical protein
MNLNLNLEEFEHIKGYENLYKMNKKGDIYSCRLRKLMSNIINDNEYLYVILYKDKCRKKCYIHRLIGIQYIDNPQNKIEIDHIDRNRQNNNLDNLRWVSRLENVHNKANHYSQMTEEQLEARKQRNAIKAKLYALRRRIKLRMKNKDVNKDI